MRKVYIWFLCLVVCAGAAVSCAARKDRGPFHPPEYPLAEKSVELLGTRVAYVEAGSGETVIFLHGIGAALSDWEKVLPFFAERYHTIAFDQPGFGKSEKRLDYPYSIDNNAAIIAALMDSKGIDKAHIVGNSMGGVIATYFAIHYPERVDRLVLVDSAGALRIPHDFGVPQLLHVVGKPYFGLTIRLGSNDPHSSDPERAQPNVTQAIYDSNEWWGCREAWRDMMVDFFKLRLKPDLEKIKAPTLVIWGENDELLYVHDKWAFRERIPESELLIMPGADHTPQLSRPREFEAALDGFFQSRPNPDYIEMEADK